MEESFFICVCGCNTWRIYDGYIKCTDPDCRKIYKLNDIQSAKYFNDNRHFLFEEPKEKYPGRIIVRSEKNKNVI